MSLQQTVRRAVFGTCIEANEFKKGYHPGTNMVKDVRGCLLADSHSIEDRCKNHLCQLLNSGLQCTVLTLF